MKKKKTNKKTPNPTTTTTTATKPKPKPKNTTTKKQKKHDLLGVDDDDKSVRHDAQETETEADDILHDDLGDSPRLLVQELDEVRGCRPCLIFCDDDSGLDFRCKHCLHCSCPISALRYPLSTRTFCKQRLETEGKLIVLKKKLDYKCRHLVLTLFAA